MINRRRGLLEQLETETTWLDRTQAGSSYNRNRRQAFDLAVADRMRNALRIDREPMSLRERYGMTLFGQDQPESGVSISASGGSEIIDVSGAGDTAVATFVLAMAAGLKIERAMRLANAASGVVVMESGTAVCSLSKLRSALPEAPRPEVVERPAVITPMGSTR